jgi:DNA-binding response OmpR family regulator
MPRTYNRGLRILVIEDDRKLAGVLRRGLEEHCHAVDIAHDGETAVAMAESTPYDLLVLDILLPRLDGFQVCRRLRARGNTAAVLMLTALDGVEDRVNGLDSGADDYLVKPFAFPELLARVRALLRRGGPSRDRILRAGDVELDTVTGQARRAGQTLDLTSRELAMLEYLLRNPDRPLTREQIAEHVWGFDSIASNVIDVYVAALRRKLGDQHEPRLLNTVRGVGYELRPPASG